MPRQRSIPTDFDARLARVVAAQGRPARAGMSRVGSDRASQRGNPNVLQDVPATGADQGRMVLLSATGVSIDSGGDVVAFNEIVHVNGFDGGLSGDGTTITWPIGAVGGAKVVLAWDTYEGGGTIELEVDGTVPPWGLFGQGSSGAEARAAIDVDAAAGSQLRLKVTQTSGVAQTCNVTLSLQVQDPSDTRSVPVVVGTSQGYADYDITVDAPEGVVAGDLLLAFVVSREPTISSPFDWSRDTFQDIGNDYAAALDVKRATAADVGATWTWSVAGGVFANRSAQVLVVAIRHASRVEASEMTYSTGVTSASETVDTAASGLVLMFTGSGRAAGVTTHTYPATMTEEAEHANVNGTSGATDTISVAAERAVGTVTRAVTLSATSDVFALLVSVV